MIIAPRIYCADRDGAEHFGDLYLCIPASVCTQQPVRLRRMLCILLHSIVSACGALSALSSFPPQKLRLSELWSDIWFHGNVFDGGGVERRRPRRTELGVENTSKGVDVGRSL